MMSGISSDSALGTTPTPTICDKKLYQDFRILTFTVRLVERSVKHAPVSETSDPVLSVSPRDYQYRGAVGISK